MPSNLYVLESRKYEEPAKARVQMGSSMLDSQYQTIGLELIKYENACCHWKIAQAEQATRSFRVGISFLPVEVLEAYLDDLLDLKISDKKLWIERPFKVAGVLVVLVILLALAVGKQSYFTAVPHYHSLILSFSLGLVILLFWQRSFHRVGRRFRFVYVLKQEISRRRGRNSTDAAMPLSEVAV